jgi:hypothetical protein
MTKDPLAVKLLLPAGSGLGAGLAIGTTLGLISRYRAARGKRPISRPPAAVAAEPPTLPDPAAPTTRNAG